jgi:cytochrome P450
MHDATFFDAIYAGGTHKRDRCAWRMHAGSKSFAGSILETLEHDKHKARRAAISVFFSKRSIQLLEPRIKHILQLLVDRLKAEKGEVVNLNCAMAAVSMDVISEYCFGESMNSMKRKEYGKEWLEIAHDGISMRPLGRQFPWLVNFMIDLPPTIAAKLSPVAEKTIAFNSKLLRKIECIMRGEDKEWDSKRKRTVFHEIRDGSLPEKEKHPFRLMGEASILLGAGTETTARTLSVTAYYIIKHDKIRRKLRQELKSVMPTKQSSVSLPMLETLPFLVSPLLPSIC